MLGAFLRIYLTDIAILTYTIQTRNNNKYGYPKYNIKLKIPIVLII